MSLTANIDMAIRTYITEAEDVSYEDLYFERDGTVFECTTCFGHLWQWFKDWISNDSQICKISDVFERVAIQYFLERSIPLTLEHTIEIKTNLVAAAKGRMDFLADCIQARQEDFDASASIEASHLFNQYCQSIRNLPLLESVIKADKEEISQLEVNVHLPPSSEGEKMNGVRSPSPQK